MIDDCINRPLITSEVVSTAMTRRISELRDASVAGVEGVTDDNRMQEAEELGHSAFWVIITELQKWRDRIDEDINDMLDEQSQAFQDRVKDQAKEAPIPFGIDRGFPSYEM